MFYFPPFFDTPRKQNILATYNIQFMSHSTIFLSQTFPPVTECEKTQSS